MKKRDIGESINPWGQATKTSCTYQKERREKDLNYFFFSVAISAKDLNKRCFLLL